MGKRGSSDGSKYGGGSSESLIPHDREEENDWFKDCNFSLVLRDVKRHADMVEAVMGNEEVRVSQLDTKSYSVWLAKLFKRRRTSNFLNVYHVGTRRGGHYAITERFTTFEDWVKDHTPIDNSGPGGWSYDNFIRPFRSLLENVINLLYERRDFRLSESNIVVVEREGPDGLKFYEMKVGVVTPLSVLWKANDDDRITCFHDLCHIVEKWVGTRRQARGAKRCRGLYLLLEDMKAMMHSYFSPSRLHHLRFLLKHPMFTPDARKGEFFEHVFRVDWIRRLVGVKINGPEQFTRDVMDGLTGMEVNCSRTPHLAPYIRKETVWFVPSLANNSFMEWFNRVPEGDLQSPYITFDFLIRSLRNFWAHLDENLTSQDTIQSCVETMDKFCPGFWHALHHAVLSSSLLEEFVEDKWFFSWQD